MIWKWITSNWLVIIGVLAGALAGFLYYTFIGCLNGTCSITSSPVNSTVYFAVTGGLFFSIFKKPKNKR